MEKQTPLIPTNIDQKLLNFLTGLGLFSIFLVLSICIFQVIESFKYFYTS